METLVWHPPPQKTCNLHPWGWQRRFIHIVNITWQYVWIDLPFSSQHRLCRRKKKTRWSIFLPNDSQVSGMVPSGSVLETRFYLQGPSRSPSSVGEGKSVGTGNSWYGMELRNM